MLSTPEKEGMVRRYPGGKDMQDLIQEDRQDWMLPRIRGQLEAGGYVPRVMCLILLMP